MRKLAVFAFSFSAAVFLWAYLDLDALLPLLWAGCALAALTAGLLLRSMPRRRCVLVLICFGLALGFLWSAVYEQLFFQPAAALDDRTVRLQATVTDYPQVGEYGGYTLVARVETEDLARPLAVLYVDEQGEDLRPGDKISAVVHYTLADHTFAGEEITYYTAKGIFLQGEVYGRLDVERPERIPVKYWPAVWADILKKGIVGVFPEEEAAIVQGIVTGNRDNLTDQFTSSLERVGLSHTVAVSGMHLAFLAQLLVTLRGRGKRSTALVTILWAVLFSALCGHTPSVDRAAIMIVLLQLAPLFNRERDLPTSLGTALMVLLALNPFAAAHMGLQLSFAAVAGIALVSDGLQERLMSFFHLDRPARGKLRRLARRIPCFVISTLSATLGASVFTVPLVACYFNTVSLISPLANVLTLWAVGLIFVGGLLAGTLGVFFPGLGQLLALPVTLLVRYVNQVVELLSHPALSALPMDSWLYRGWLIYGYLLLMAALVVRGRKRGLIPFCAGVFTLVLALVTMGAASRLGDMRVTALDVGQGQSVILRQRNLNALVDCGGDTWDNPGDIAANYLQSRGIGRLDLLILTHCHDDHANGVPQLLERMEVGKIFLPDGEEDSDLGREILALAEEKGTQVELVTEDLRIRTDEDQFLTLYAPISQVGESNERGLSVLADGGSFRALITGDMDAAGEEKLLDIAGLTGAEVLVAGHHGSEDSTSQALLDAVQPEYALISVGEDNSYGHPAQATLDRLAAAGAEVYRTDQDGTIEIRR